MYKPNLLGIYMYIIIFNNEIYRFTVSNIIRRGKK